MRCVRLSVFTGINTLLTQTSLYGALNALYDDCIFQNPYQVPACSVGCCYGALQRALRHVLSAEV